MQNFTFPDPPERDSILIDLAVFDERSTVSFWESSVEPDGYLLQNTLIYGVCKSKANSSGPYEWMKILQRLSDMHVHLDVLVTPIRVVPRFADLTQEEVCDLFLAVHTIAPVLERQYQATSLSITIQDGRDAGQSVEHVHVHVIPRRQGDFFQNDEVYQKVYRSFGVSE